MGRLDSLKHLFGGSRELYPPRDKPILSMQVERFVSTGEMLPGGSAAPITQDLIARLDQSASLSLRGQEEKAFQEAVKSIGRYKEELERSIKRLRDFQQSECNTDRVRLARRFERLLRGYIGFCDGTIRLHHQLRNDPFVFGLTNDEFRALGEEEDDRVMPFVEVAQDLHIKLVELESECQTFYDACDQQMSGLEQERGRLQKQRKRQDKQKIRTRERWLANSGAEPGSAQYYLKLGHWCLKNGEYDTAKDNYVKALSLGTLTLKEEGIANYLYAIALWISIKKFTQKIDNEWDREQLRHLEDEFNMDTGYLRFRPLYRLSFTPSYDGAGDETLFPYYSEAERAFKRHLKSQPDDLEAVEMLSDLYHNFSKDQKEASIEVQIERIKTRKKLTGEQAAPSSGRVAAQKDRTGLSFEDKCLRVLKAMGFIAQVTKRTGDGGIDLIATSSQPVISGKYIVQCKDWANPVGEPPLRDLYGVVSDQKANKGILITSSTFTDAAIEFAKGKQLELIDGDQLGALEQEYLKSEA